MPQWTKIILIHCNILQFLDHYVLRKDWVRGSTSIRLIIQFSFNNNNNNITYLSLKAVFLAYRCRDPSSMINLIFWKNEAVEAGGCRCNKISIGLATVAHNWLPLQTDSSQHSGSWQSINPSKKYEKNPI